MTSRIRIVFSVRVMFHSICRNEIAFSYVFPLRMRPGCEYDYQPQPHVQRATGQVQRAYYTTIRRDASK